MSNGRNRHGAMHGALGALVLGSSLWLVACGGGGGGASTAPATDTSGSGGSTGGASGGTGGSSSGSTSTGLAALQAQLDTCPVGSQFNKVMACMQGLYVGRATDDGSPCALRYDERGVTWYTSNRASNRLSLSSSSSGASYYKAAQAGSASGYMLSLTVGIASGAQMDLLWQDPKEPGSATGLLVKTHTTSAPDCLITTPPEVAASSSLATTNLTGRRWDSPTALDTLGSGGLPIDSGATGNTGFEAGLADDGTAWITFAHTDDSGRLAVQVVRGQAGTGSQASTWSAPLVLDAMAPLVAGYRPRLAVSPNGHAVVTWMTDRACGADGYESSPAGKTCHYMMASRRLAGTGTWEAPQVVGASPPTTIHDHHVRINTAGDVVVTYVGTGLAGADIKTTMLGLRAAADSAFRRSRPFDLRSNYGSGEALEASIATALDDRGNLVVAGKRQSFMGLGAVGLVSTLSTAPDTWRTTDLGASETWFDELATSDGFAAYTTQTDTGARQVLRPEHITFWSPVQQRWLPAESSADFAIWGDTRLVGTDTAGGEFLLYGGCRLNRWVAGAWSDTLVTLPPHCGLDRSGGLYAFNRLGDYVGLHWGGHAGQWGYYRRADNTLLKGAPGTATAVAGDYLLGAASALFAPADSQLLLNRNGVALAVTASTYTAMPTASQAGTNGGGALRLWATFLR